jgi:hypothetical protein
MANNEFNFVTDSSNTTITREKQRQHKSFPYDYTYKRYKKAIELAKIERLKTLRDRGWIPVQIKLNSHMRILS